MSDNGDRSGDNQESTGDENSQEEYLRKLFGEAFGDMKDDDADQDSESTDQSSQGPSMGFGGNLGANSGEQSDPSQGFPGMPPGFDPSMLGGFGADPQMMQQIMGQVQAMFSAMQNEDDSSVVNWDVTMSSALAAVQEEDPSVTAAEHHEIDSALRLAEMWLDEATSFPSLGQVGQGTGAGRRSGPLVSC